MIKKIVWVVELAAFFLIFTFETGQASYLKVKDSGFTELPVSARSLGMGGAFVGVADDYSACYYNPAGLVNLKSPEIGSMYTDLYGLGLLSHSFLSFVEPDTGMGSGGISWSHLLADLEPERWRYDLVVYSYANYFEKETGSAVSWGVNLKYIIQTTSYEDGYGYSLDVGYLKKWKKTCFGVCIRDVFSKINWETGNEDTIPSTFTTGLAFRISNRALVSFDVNSSFQNLLREIKIGGEWEISDKIFFRSGLFQKFQEDEALNFSLGLGLNASLTSKIRVIFDYAFVSSHQLSDTHYLSISLKF